MAPQHEVSEENSAPYTELKAKLIQILKTHGGIQDEIEKIIIREPPELKGEHMATATVYGKVEFKDESLRPKNIFIKKFMDNPMHTEWIKTMQVMEKESSFFNEYLPYAQKFCDNNTGSKNLMTFFPKFIYGDDEIVVLDNLVLDDTFIMLSKEEKQDLETAKVVLTNLAKFHAVNYSIIKDLGAEEFRKKFALNCTECFDSTKNPAMAQMFDGSVGTALNVLQKYPELEGQQETIEKLGGMMGKMFPELETILRSNLGSNGFVVLNHGDCWNNNMLFKLDSETGKITEHIFVDFQITRFGSPCLDVGYFLFSSVKPYVRRAHLTELLRHYFDEFTKTTEVFGQNCGLNFDEFVEDFRKNYRLGYFFNLSMITAIGAFKEIDGDTMGTDPEKAMEMFTKVINQWVEDNPDKTEEIAKELIAVVREAEDLLVA